MDTSMDYDILADESLKTARAVKLFLEEDNFGDSDHEFTECKYLQKRRAELADPVKEPGLNEAEPQPSVFDEADGSRRSDVFSGHHAGEVDRAEHLAEEPATDETSGAGPACSCCSHVLGTTEVNFESQAAQPSATGSENQVEVPHYLSHNVPWPQQQQVPPYVYWGPLPQQQQVTPHMYLLPCVLLVQQQQQQQPPCANEEVPPIGYWMQLQQQQQQQQPCTNEEACCPRDCEDRDCGSDPEESVEHPEGVQTYHKGEPGSVPPNPQPGGSARNCVRDTPGPPHVLGQTMQADLGKKDNSKRQSAKSKSAACPTPPSGSGTASTQNHVEAPRHQSACVPSKGGRGGGPAVPKGKGTRGKGQVGPSAAGAQEPVKIQHFGALEAPNPGRTFLTGPDHLCRRHHVLGVTQAELRKEDNSKLRAAKKSTEAARPAPSRGSAKGSAKNHVEATHERLLLVEKAVEKLVQEGRHAELVMMAKTVREQDEKLDRPTVRLLLKRLVKKHRLQLVKDSPGTFEVTLMGEQTGPAINEEDVEWLQQHIADGIENKVEGYLVTEVEGITSRSMLGAHYREFFPKARDGDLYEGLRRLQEKGYFVMTKSPQGRYYETSENFKRTVDQSEAWYQMRTNVQQLFAEKDEIPVSVLKKRYYGQYHEMLDHEAFGYVKFLDLLKDGDLVRLKSRGSHHIACRGQ